MKLERSDWHIFMQKFNNYYDSHDEYRQRNDASPVCSWTLFAMIAGLMGLITRFVVTPPIELVPHIEFATPFQAFTFAFWLVLWIVSGLVLAYLEITGKAFLTSTQMINKKYGQLFIHNTDFDTFQSILSKLNKNDGPDQLIMTDLRFALNEDMLDQINKIIAKYPQIPVLTRLLKDSDTLRHVNTDKIDQLVHEYATQLRALDDDLVNDLNRQINSEFAKALAQGDYNLLPDKINDKLAEKRVDAVLKLTKDK